MKKRLFAALIIVIMTTAFSFGNEFKFNTGKLDFRFDNSFNLQKSAVRYRNSNNGAVASDREAINSETFHLFVTFRNASIGMFVPGTLIGMGAVTAVTVLYFVAASISNCFDTLTPAQFMTIFAAYMPGFYTIMAFGILSAIFIVCGTAFAICAGVLHHKWAKSKNITSFNNVSSDKPMFAQGFSIAL